MARCPVVSLNLHRRQLTTAQRAAVAAEIATLERGSNQHVGMNADGPMGPPSPTTAQAAKVMGVSVRSVKRARAVKKEDPEKFEAMKRGEVRGGCQPTSSSTRRRRLRASDVS